MAILRPGEAFSRVQSEIEKEKAEALGRAGARLAQAIRTLRLIRDEVEALEGERATPADPEEGSLRAIARRRAEYGRLYRTAQEYLHFLVIQREALGFRRHVDVDRQYPMPEPLDDPRSARREMP